MKTRLLTMLVVLLAALGAPASATHGGIHPTFRSERVYFHCTGATKLYNINYWISESNTGWSTTPPAQSVQEGAGCGGLEYGGFTNEAYDVVFEGTFTGNLRDMTIDVHQLLLGNARQATTETLRLNAWIDGVPIFPVGTQPTNGRTVTVAPVRSSSGASERFLFSITNLGFARDIFDADGKLIDVETGGVALEDGDGSAEHTFLLYLGTHGNTTSADLKTKLGAWVWDTTEVPSGITFNPSTLEPARVAADLPVFEQ
ncbi:MAG TPA: hypothetical protein VGB51_03270 [Actinomycetota bacterium]